MKIICPSYVNTALELLKKSGFKAYIVGGCVRDSIMGRTANDWDMTTSALPEETMNVFSGFRTIPTGIKHGTVTVLIEGKPLEITTMRIDGEYTDSRRPDSVDFTTEIEKDLSRRDFTVNAMAYNHEDGLIDPFGGKLDIENELIRCVGNPDKRFGEDALRIIRALRFASVLGFDIDSETAQSIMNNHSTLGFVAAERIRVELVKLLTGKNVEKILTEFKDVIFGIIPELQAEDGFLQHSPYHIYDVWTHTVKVVGAIKDEPVFRVAALLHDICKPETFKADENGRGHFKGHSYIGAEKAKVIMKRLRFSNAEINTVYNIIYLHDERDVAQRTKLAHLCSEFSIEAVRNTIVLQIADLAGKSKSTYNEEIKIYNKAIIMLDEFEAESICLSLSDLEINGNDLIKLGIKGERIKAVLTELLNTVIDGKIENKKEKLLAEAEKLGKF